MIGSRRDYNYQRNQSLTYMQSLSALEGKTIVELREIAKVLGIAPSTMKKKELLDKIIAVATASSASTESTSSTESNTNNVEESNQESAPRRGRRPRMSSVKVGGPAPRVEVAVAESESEREEEPEVVEETEVEKSAEERVEERPVQRRRGRKPRWLIEQENREQEAEQETVKAEAESQDVPELEASEEVVEGSSVVEEDYDEDYDDLEDMEDDEFFDEEFDEETITKDDFKAEVYGEGVLEIIPDGYGFRDELQNVNRIESSLRQHKMPHDNALFHYSVRVKFRAPDLTVHLS